MKPQFHPSADNITIESILHALSDPAGVQSSRRLRNQSAGARAEMDPAPLYPILVHLR